MKHIVTLDTRDMAKSAVKGGCGECQTSCRVRNCRMADPGEGLYPETHIMHTMGHALDEGMAHCASETKIFQKQRFRKL